MARQDAEILQILQDFADAKKLSVSKITMQKRAAKLAAKQLEQAEEDLAIADIQEDLEVLHDNIRDERAKQKREDEEAARKAAKSDKGKDTDSGSQTQSTTALPPEVTEALDWIRSQKNLSIAEERRKAINERVYKEGASKDDKTLIDKLISTHSITHETDENDVVTKVLDIYNTIKSSTAGKGAVVAGTGGADNQAALDKVIEEAKKF